VEKPKVGICGLTGCAGDQLVILNCEDELLDIAEAVDIKFFPMAISGNDEKCPLDIVFVEGTVVQPKDKELLKRLRQRASLLIAIGTCAVWGGMPAMKNEIAREKLKKQVYGRKGEMFKTLVPQPLSNFVKVDLAISGCPIEQPQLLQAIASLLHGDLPCLPNYAVCTVAMKNLLGTMYARSRDESRYLSRYVADVGIALTRKLERIAINGHKPPFAPRKRSRALSVSFRLLLF